MNEITKISSRDNQRLVAVRKVRDGHDDQLIFIEGKRLVEEALHSSLEITECFFASSFTDEDLLYAAADRAENTFELTEKLFDSIADTKNPQGIILIAKRPVDDAAAIEKRLLSGLPIVLYLKEINNPSNLGAILRTSEAAGVAGVIVSKNSADGYSPKALRAAMGSAFRLPVWQNVDFAEVIEWAKKMGLTITATDIGADKSYYAIDWKTPRLLVFGSEAHGLSADEIAMVDQAILIQMENPVESLNLAVSAGVILFEARRQNTV